MCSVTGSTVEQVKVKSRPFRMRVRARADAGGSGCGGPHLSLRMPHARASHASLAAVARLQFGLKAEQAAGSSTLCINLDGRTLLLHDLSDRARAIELLFRPRCASPRGNHTYHTPADRLSSRGGGGAACTGAGTGP